MEHRRKSRSFLLPVFVFLFTFLLGTLAAYAAGPAVRLHLSNFRSLGTDAAVISGSSMLLP